MYVVRQSTGMWYAERLFVDWSFGPNCRQVKATLRRLTKLKQRYAKYRQGG